MTDADLAAELAELRAELADLRDQNQALRSRCDDVDAELSRLRPYETGAVDPQGGASSTPPLPRRQLLRAAGAAAAGGVAATVAAARPALAANGDPLQLGESNSATSTTTVTRSTAGYVLRVRSTPATGEGRAVVGETASNTGRGVYGLATADGANTFAMGVQGVSESASGVGVEGRTSATSAIGVRGIVAGDSARGVHGEAVSSTGQARGVLGTSGGHLGIGVEGFAGHAIGSTIGVMGRVSSTAGTAVYARASATSGLTHALYASCDSPDGYGAFVVGRSKVEGDLEVAGRTDSTQIVVRSEETAAVDARSSAHRGAVLNGMLAQLRLIPRAGRPESGSGGDFFVDGQTRLWFCKGGTDWVQLA